MAIAISGNSYVLFLPNFQRVLPNAKGGQVKGIINE